MPSGEFDEIRAAFQALMGENHRKSNRKALKKVGVLMRDAIKQRAPSQAGEGAGGVLKPGELAASIKEHVHVPTDEQILAGKPSSVVVAPEGRVYGIAVAVENGHVARRGGKRAGPPKFVPAHPFIRPAFDATRAEGEALYEASMVEDIQKAME